MNLKQVFEGITKRHVLAWLLVFVGGYFTLQIMNSTFDYHKKDVVRFGKLEWGGADHEMTRNSTESKDEVENWKVPEWNAEMVEEYDADSEYEEVYRELETTMESDYLERVATWTESADYQRTSVTVSPVPVLKHPKRVADYQAKLLGQERRLENFRLKPRNDPANQRMDTSPSGLESSAILDSLSKFRPPKKDEVYKHIRKEEGFDIKPPIRFMKKFRNPCYVDARKYLRCLPKAYLLGFTKCATTDLWAKLGEHPNIRSGDIKEMHWWSKERFFGIRGLNSYYAGYYGRSLLNSNVRRETRITIDASPDSLWDPGRIFLAKNRPKHVATHILNAPRVLPASLIKEYTPDAKFIVIMRNPTKRLYSHYLYEGTLTTGKEYVPTIPRSQEKFHKTVQKLIEDLKTCFRKRTVRDCVYDPTFLMRGLNKRVFLHVGLYVVFLSDWLKIIPRDQFFTVTSEEYGNNTRAVMGDMFKFLGLGDESSVKERRQTMERVLSASRPNPGSLHGVNIGEMWESTKKLLDDFYRPFNEALATLLNDKKYLWKE